jgi:uncharacterized damage-inducible protein DinB
MQPEAAAYLERIEDVRGQVADLVRSIPDEALNWRPIDGADDHATNSVAVLATHLAGAEHFWMAEVVGRYPPTRDRDAEFVTTVESGDALLRRLEEVAAETRDVLSSISQEELNDSRLVRGKQVPIRWAILHVIDHSSLHLGHIQLTYQLWRGGQSGGSPRWFQRLKE